MFSNYINDFKLILMFSIFMSDDTNLSTQDPLGHIAHDLDLVNSKDIHEAVEKGKAKLNDEVIRLLMSHPQMDETKAKIDRLLLRVHCLNAR